MTHLIPEQRMDKNGKLVTRHVRPIGDAATRGAMPAPTASAPAAVSWMDKERHFAMSRFAHESSILIHPASSMGKMNFEFDACDSEVYDVMSVTNQGNAFILLEMGIRTSDEAVSYLREHNAESLIMDNSALMQEMIDRGIPSDQFARVYENFPPSLKAASKYVADGVELATNETLKESGSLNSTVNDVLDGRIKLADLKALGDERLDGRLFFLREPLMRHAADEATFTMDQLVGFIDRKDMSRLSGTDFGTALDLFEKLGTENINKIDDMGMLVACYRQELPTSVAERKEEVERAFYQARIAEGIQTGAHRPATYWANGIRRDVDQLRQAGVTVEEAVPHMRDGYSAQETIGILSGIESSISGGWL